MNQSGCALEDVSDELKGDREVALAAVNHSGRALDDASNELKGNKEVALAAQCSAEQRNGAQCKSKLRQEREGERERDAEERA